MSKNIRENNNNENKPKIVAILGPTASGKTALAVKLAKIFNGEIISADSRQVFRGMDIGTGKDLNEYGPIKHHLIDVVEPMEEFNLAKFQSLSFEAISDILKSEKLPIFAGGTGMYLQSVVDNFDLSAVAINKDLRDNLERKNLEELLQIVEDAYPEIYNNLNESEKGNKRHLIRYIEIAEKEEDFKLDTRKKPSKYQYLIIGLSQSKEVLEERIYKRIITRIENEDMIGEVRRLHENGVTWQRLLGFGLEYQFVSLYLQGKCDYETMIEKLFIASRQFAKRQMTWFKRWEKQGEKIHWVESHEEAEKLVREFVK